MKKRPLESKGLVSTAAKIGGAIPPSPVPQFRRPCYVHVK